MAVNRSHMAHGKPATASAVHEVESTRPPRVLVAFVRSLAASGTCGTTSWRDRREYQSQIRADLPPQSCNLTLRTSCIHCGCELPGMASSEEHCHTFVTHYSAPSTRLTFTTSQQVLEPKACLNFVPLAKPTNRSNMPSHYSDKERLLNDPDTDSEVDNASERIMSPTNRSRHEGQSTNWKTLAILILTIVVSNLCTGLFVVKALKTVSNSGVDTSSIPKAHEVQKEEQEDPPTIRKSLQAH